jgi:small subunit ribosomal protein S5
MEKSYSKHDRTKSRKPAKVKSEFEQKMLDLARVARVVKGGKRFKFRALVVIGNKKGKVGIGLAKGLDVTAAIEKAVNKAKKNLIEIDVTQTTIPYALKYKFKAAKLLIKPASKGHGIIAGSCVRNICDLAGIKNISVKILGCRSKINNSVAMIGALKELYNIR